MMVITIPESSGHGRFDCLETRRGSLRCKIPAGPTRAEHYTHGHLFGRVGAGSIRDMSGHWTVVPRSFNRWIVFVAIPEMRIEGGLAA